MPVYEYKCKLDDLHPFLNVTRSISDADPGYRCEVCNSEMTRHYSPFGIKFNGGGFYKTDNPK